MTPSVVEVDGFDGAVAPGGPGFDPADHDAVARFWSERTAANPKLYNGPILLADEVAIEAGRFRARYRETRFSALMWWRAAGFPDCGLHNVFGAAAVVSSDGAVLLGRMAPHTSNAGRVYFPAGTPDRDDVVGEAVDLEGSILRELKEETGLAAPVARATERRIVVRTGALIACVRRFDAGLDAAGLRLLVERFLAADPEPEFDSILLARSAADLTDASPAFVHAAVAHLL